MDMMLLDSATMILAERQGLTVRLATHEDDVRAAQELRYRIFYEELGAKADTTTRATRRDQDRFDAFSDHLLVFNAEQILVGTYRLLRQDVAVRHGGFYSEQEFDLAPLLARHPNLRFLEVGRSCVADGYRGKPVAELLWQGIWNYVRHHRLDVMLGCASLPGTDCEALRAELSFLSHIAPTPSDWQVSALPDRRIDMARMPLTDVDQKQVLRKLPTLVKAYMRLGCYFGDGAVADHQFNTTDVFIVLPVSAINPKYFNHYGAPQPN